jgi:membrane fusion protein (multidrug efflux system)
MKLHRALTPVAVITLATLATGCGKPAQQQQQMPPPEVDVMTVKANAVPIVQDLVGRITAVRMADVRARVAGVLQKRVYTEGTDVKEGELLFQIDPAPLRATLNAQLANLAAAQATYQNNHVAAERARSVAQKGLLSKADVDAADAAERTAAAAVKQAQANVEAAKINLGYANVTAPIAGRAGKQQVTEGALVGQGEATLLTTIEQIDRVYVNFSQAIGSLDDVRRAAAKGEVQLYEEGKAKVEITMPDGSSYDKTGALDFSDTAVDAATGAVTLRGIVPNPEHHLLPGMYVNVHLTLGDLKRAWILPQAAIQRDAEGAYVYVLGADGNIARKTIDVYTSRGADSIVKGGLADGDQVVVSGLMKVHPGAPAKAAAPRSDAQPAQPKQADTH